MLLYIWPTVSFLMLRDLWSTSMFILPFKASWNPCFLQGMRNGSQMKLLITSVAVTSLYFNRKFPSTPALRPHSTPPIRMDTRVIINNVNKNLPCGLSGIWI